jgi:SAM-dependent methyltransferase
MLPLLYHEHHKRHLEDLPFWLELAQQQGSPILELGCGSGRVLLPLAEAGYHLYGLDKDEAMLALLSEQIRPHLRDRITLILGDMTSFQIPQRFALIILPCNTFSSLGSSERRATLQQVHNHLAQQGLFAVSLPNPQVLRRLPRRAEAEVEEHFPHPLDGQPVQVSSSWERTSQHFVLFWHYDHLLPDGRVERYTIHVCHSLEPAEVYFAEIEATGLSIVERFGDFDKTPYSPESPFLILTATPRA